MALTFPRARSSVDFRDLHFAYAEGRFALQHVDLHVPAGTTCALVGRTGSGKSTLASLVSRAVGPEPGSVLLGGRRRPRPRRAAAPLRGRCGHPADRDPGGHARREHHALRGRGPRADVEAAVVELGLEDWVAGLTDGLDTLLGPGGTTLSAGEEQLVAFARLLVRHVRVVVLDEATARMDPVTEAHVVRAADRLLSGRTGLLVAHRLSTTERAEQVAVLDGGQVVQRGPRSLLAAEPGPFRSLLEASAEEEQPVAGAETTRVGTARRTGDLPPPPVLAPVPGLARATLSALMIEPRWGMVSVLLFLASAVTGAFGTITGWIWGHLVVTLQDDRSPDLLTAALVVSLLVSPLLLASAFRRYPRWWIAVMLRVRTAVLVGQTAQHRLGRTPPGEVVARTMDADRLARYADRWVDFFNGLAIAALTALLAKSLLAGGVLLAVMLTSALASSFGRRVAGRSAAASAAARARFGRTLVSALDSVRTVKLAASTPSVHSHLRDVDGGRVEAAVREHRVQALLDGVPIVMVQCGVVAAWALLLADVWGLATALLVAGAVTGFDWFGRVAGSVITEAPGTRIWMQTTSRLAGGGDLMHLPAGVDLVSGAAPAPLPGPRDPLRTLELRGVSAIHDDGTIGVSDVDLTIGAQELVLLLGQVGSGKSSLLSALAGLVSSTGEICWNGEPGHRHRGLSAAGPGRPCGAGASGAVRLLHRQRAPRPPRPCWSGPPSRPPGCCRTSRTPAVRTRWSAIAVSASPVARSSGSPWPGGSPATPRCCSLTTCPQRSTRPPRSSSGLLCASRAPPSSAPRPSGPRWPRPIGSWCWWRAGLPPSARGRSSAGPGATWPGSPGREPSGRPTGEPLRRPRWCGHGLRY